ncbi:MAG TPA: hypothetical protein PK686_04025 [bacterium]|nr:hypothetical protein [bacterium]HPV65810.1 hypothetical protein [bacterium]
MEILAILFLILLFFLLSKSADLIVLNLRKTGEKLGIKIFILGIILGIMTSTPEMAIGINSTLMNVPDMSFGNLVGGTIVLLALILGISLILNRKIKTEENSWPFLATLIVLFMPLILAFKGRLNEIDGIIMIISYILIVYFLYKKNKSINWPKIEIVNSKEIIKHIFWILIGIVLLTIISDLIVKTTMFVLRNHNISPFIIGLLFYSIGTNLPELIIAIRSFKRKVEELSFSNLIGSAISNVLMLGFLSFIKPIDINIDAAYFFLIIFNISLFILIYIFYRTDQLLSRIEGFVLLMMYLVFIGGQVVMQVK